MFGADYDPSSGTAVEVEVVAADDEAAPVLSYVSPDFLPEGETLGQSLPQIEGDGLFLHYATSENPGENELRIYTNTSAGYEDVRQGRFLPDFLFAWEHGTPDATYNYYLLPGLNHTEGDEFYWALLRSSTKLADLSTEAPLNSSDYALVFLGHSMNAEAEFSLKDEAHAEGGYSLAATNAGCSGVGFTLEADADSGDEVIWTGFVGPEPTSLDTCRFGDLALSDGTGEAAFPPDSQELTWNHRATTYGTVTLEGGGLYLADINTHQHNETPTHVATVENSHCHTGAASNEILFSSDPSESDRKLLLETFGDTAFEAHLVYSNPASACGQIAAEGLVFVDEQPIAVDWDVCEEDWPYTLVDELLISYGIQGFDDNSGTMTCATVFDAGYCDGSNVTLCPRACGSSLEDVLEVAPGQTLNLKEFDEPHFCLYERNDQGERLEVLSDLPLTVEKPQVLLVHPAEAKAGETVLVHVDAAFESDYHQMFLCPSDTTEMALDYTDPYDYFGGNGACYGLQNSTVEPLGEQLFALALPSVDDWGLMENAGDFHLCPRRHTGLDSCAAFTVAAEETNLVAVQVTPSTVPSTGSWPEGRCSFRGPALGMRPPTPRANPLTFSSMEPRLFSVRMHRRPSTTTSRFPTQAPKTCCSFNALQTARFRTPQPGQVSQCCLKPPKPLRLR